VNERRPSARLLKLSAYAVAVASVWGGPAAGAALAAPPTIGVQWVTGITPIDATLNAEINPNGLLTGYKLQIDTTGNFAFFQTDSCLLHTQGVMCAEVVVDGDPLPPGLVQPEEARLPAGSETQNVSVTLSSIGATLQPGTTYHYRAVAANGLEIVRGPHQTFTTPLAGGPPIVEPYAGPTSANGHASGGRTASGGLAFSSAPPSQGRRRHGGKRAGRCTRERRRRSGARQRRAGKQLEQRRRGSRRACVDRRRASHR
jgi:hypothetical protein